MSFEVGQHVGFNEEGQKTFDVHPESVFVIDEVSSEGWVVKLNRNFAGTYRWVEAQDLVAKPAYDLISLSRDPLSAKDASAVLQRVWGLVRAEPDGSALLYLYDSLQREFAKGIRCGVCGRVDGGDDCIYGC